MISLVHNTFLIEERGFLYINKKKEVLYIYSYCLLTPIDGICFSQSQVFYQRPGCLRILCSILGVPSTAFFCKESTNLPEICGTTLPA